MTERTDAPSGRIEATVHEKAAMFEWLRSIAIEGGNDWRKAAIAMQELNAVAKAHVSDSATSRDATQLLERWLSFLILRWTGKGYDQQAQELIDESKAYIALKIADQQELRTTTASPVSDSPTPAEPAFSSMRDKSIGSGGPMCSGSTKATSAPCVVNAPKVEAAIRSIFGSWHACAMGTGRNPLHPEDEKRGIKKGQLCDDCESGITAYMKDLTASSSERPESREKP